MEAAAGIELVEATIGTMEAPAGLELVKAAAGVVEAADIAGSSISITCDGVKSA